MELFSQLADSIIRFYPRITSIALLADSSLEVLAASGGAPSEEQLRQYVAIRLAQSAVEACAADKYNVSVAVVDRAGNVRALLRADAAGPHTLDSATRKAYTSASTRTPTAVLVENIAKNPSAAELTTLEGFLVLAGGVPVKSGDETIGAIGVGGAPSGAIDEACAVAAIDANAELLK